MCIRDRIPVVLFLASYLGTMLLVSPSAAGIAGGVGFAAGIGIAVLYDRRLRRQGGLRFTIVRLF